MAWWMRPGPSRFCASAKPSPGLPMTFSFGTRTFSYRISACPPGSPVLWSGSPMVGTSRRMFTPGVFVGTRIIENDRYGDGVGVEVRLAHDDQEVADRRVRAEPLVPVDDPLVAVEHGLRGEQRGVGAGARLGHREAAAQLAVEQRLHPLLLLLVGAADGDQLGVARVRGVVAEDRRARTAHCPRISCIRPSFTWPKPLPPMSGGRWAAQRSWRFTSFLQRRRDLRELLARPSGVRHRSASVSSGMISSRTNVRVHSSFVFEFGFGGEVPRHGRSSFLFVYQAL